MHAASKLNALSASFRNLDAPFPQFNPPEGTGGLHRGQSLTPKRGAKSTQFDATLHGVVPSDRLADPF